YRYLAQKSVQTELKLTEEQITELARAQAKWTEATRGVRDWTAAELRGKLAKATASLDEWLQKELKPAQFERFEQIVMQNLTTSPVFGALEGGIVVATPTARRTRVTPGLSMLLQYPPAVKALGLSKKQIEDTGAVIREAQRRTTLIRTELARIPGSAADLTAKTQAVHREQAEKKLLALLTEKQQEAAKKLL